MYCACFSAVHDDLSQWRGYGENGGEYVSEFDLTELVIRFNGIEYWVIYGNSNDQSIQAAVATELVRYLNIILSKPFSQLQFLKLSTRKYRNSYLRLAHTRISVQAFCLQSRRFRIVYSETVGDPVATCFRPNPFILFVKLSMRNGKMLPVKSIRLGPAISNDLIFRSCPSSSGQVEIAPH